MERKIIIIKHVTGEHRIKIDSEHYQSFYDGIEKCLKGERNCAGVIMDNKTILYPAELLRNSVITFESSDLNTQEKNNLQKIYNLL